MGKVIAPPVAADLKPWGDASAVTVEGIEAAMANPHKVASAFHWTSDKGAGRFARSAHDFWDAYCFEATQEGFARLQQIKDQLLAAQEDPVATAFEEAPGIPLAFVPPKAVPLPFIVEDPVMVVSERDAAMLREAEQEAPYEADYAEDYRLITTESGEGGLDRIELEVEGAKLRLDLPHTDEALVSISYGGHTKTLGLNPKHLLLWLRRAEAAVVDECDVDDED